ncbi:MotA/TolQ/ExbB proton channel family protein [Leptolyngbya sp. NIES-2104]|uniref:MotA/TolQ/ExbB proton channel family protein n=1 Tax=Leptolyngbya sp. NIES-2104 TaxID=1552121 RepID=UPI0006EC4652|nr:MotA/TolQ/ExbB proton channel family protein [Leptolyngbya sp. NIES-2104]GAP94141.1 ferric siderophore transport system, biopolymer transport protein ExbB [Leptolyngbya sp. NIES-2104]
MNNAIGILKAGGIVMIPLLLFSITAIGLIIERSRYWSRIIKRQPKMMQRVLMLYQENDVAEAIAVLKKNIDLPAARILLAALSLDRPTPEQFRLAMQAEAQAETPGMKRFTNIFDVIVGLSPLFGLLGTVLGLIVSFASLNLGNVGGSQTAGVTGGISEALVSTAAGLVVAIFNLFAVSIFRGFFTRQSALIQEYANRFELIYSRRYEDQHLSRFHS